MWHGSMTPQQIDKFLSEIMARQYSRGLMSKPCDTDKIDLTGEPQKFIEAFRKAEPQFDVDKSDKQLLNSLLAWVWKYDPWNVIHVEYDKGFFFTGPIGVGKSTLLRGLRYYMNSVSDRGLIDGDCRFATWFKSASELANEYASKGMDGITDYTTGDHNLIIDELGREPLPANHFGTKINVLQHILQQRYDHRRERVTHATSNYSFEDIAGLYGDYVADRFREMFNIIPCNGQSLRHR